MYLPWRGSHLVIMEAGSKTALVIVDVQYFDAHPDYGWGRQLAEQGVAQLAAPFFERLQTTVVPNLQVLQQACRAAGVEVAALAAGPATSI